MMFRAHLPRRGRKAQDNRLFREAPRFFTVENARWHALPKEFGNWNSVWERFARLSKARAFQAIFATLDSFRVRPSPTRVFSKVNRAAARARRIARVIPHKNNERISRPSLQRPLKARAHQAGLRTPQASPGWGNTAQNSR
ncbi:MAG: transposase [Rhodospirillales bacterium]|nr:transposase [Rhodospirillales bacterium]